jgi:CDGSH-type Zn-finger protein
VPDRGRDLSAARRIEVTPHGPYEVAGDVRLVHKTIVRTGDRDPIAWRTGAEIEHGPTYYLCRCGGSSTKPFCDGTHAFDLFDGTEAAVDTMGRDRAGIEEHDGPGIRVLKDGPRCHQAHFCVNRVTNWFEMIPDSVDPSVLAQLTAMIEHCPSGALAYELEDRAIEPDLEPGIAAVDDGPLFVTGGLEVTRSDGARLPVRNRTSLCRCGRSSNKPLCDGTHAAIGFRA